MTDPNGIAPQSNPPKDDEKDEEPRDLGTVFSKTSVKPAMDFRFGRGSNMDPKADGSVTTSVDPLSSKTKTETPSVPTPAQPASVEKVPVLSVPPLTPSSSTLPEPT